MPTKEQVIEAAKLCFDPEIPVNIWDLGLIYDIEAAPDSGAVKIRMSLTSQSCPSAQEIPAQLRNKIVETCGTEDVDVELVFDPPWTPERISEEGKKKLGLNEQ
ncbi:MAG: metal-sulfur cluster assembly factor [Candidatus Omnitrophota bacterium]|nr:metal-sulfur cluster assembly factor [Candidatus Omnitrophota bacterium]